MEIPARYRDQREMELEDKLIARFAIAGAASGFILGAYRWADMFANADQSIRNSMGGDTLQGYGLMCSGLLGAALLGIVGAYAGGGVSAVVQRLRREE